MVTRKKGWKIPGLDKDTGEVTRPLDEAVKSRAAQVSPKLKVELFPPAKPTRKVAVRKP